MSQAPLADPPVWQQMADFLCEPHVGVTLLADLRTKFPHARRDDVYQAIAMAWTYLQSGWLADAIELETLQREEHKKRKL